MTGEPTRPLSATVAAEQSAWAQELLEVLYETRTMADAQSLVFELLCKLAERQSEATILAVFAGLVRARDDQCGSGGHRPVAEDPLVCDRGVDPTG